MPRPALQLYSVRDADEPLPDVVRRAAAAGYEGVEFATRVRSADRRALARALRETGLEAVGAHVGLRRLEADPEAVVESYAPLGCRSIVVPHASHSHFRTPRRVRSLARRLNRLGAFLADRGFELHYHTQSYEFRSLDSPALLDRLSGVFDPASPSSDPGRDDGGGGTVGRRVGVLYDAAFDRLVPPRAPETFEETALHYLLHHTSDEYVSVQPDAGNVAAAGFRPATVLEAVGDRARLVHLKDGSIESTGPIPVERPAPIGAGDVDLRDALAAADRIGAEWAIVENDDPDDPNGPIENGMYVLG